MKKENDNEERLIETIVTIGTLIFFGLLSMYAMRGCSDNNMAVNGNLTTAHPVPLVVASAETGLPEDESVNSSDTLDLVADVNNSAVVDINLTSNEDDTIETADTINQDTNSINNAVKSTVSDKIIEDDVNKNAQADKNTLLSSDKTLADNSRSEANEEAGILADINSEKISSKPYILKGIYFKSGSSILTKKSKRQLDAIAKALKAHKNVKITIRGHTDSRGSNKKNKTLSFKRASSTGMALVERGVNIDNIWIDGMGETEPITKNGTAKEMLLNRRVDIAVTK